MKVVVVHSSWACGDAEPISGSQEINVTPENAPLIAGAKSAGAIKILDASDSELALLDGHVQTQEDGETAYETAVASGDWAASEGSATLTNAEGAAEVLFE